MGDHSANGIKPGPISKTKETRAENTENGMGDLSSLKNTAGRGTGHQYFYLFLF